MSRRGKNSKRAGFERPRDEWAKDLEDVVRGLEQQIMDDVHHRKAASDGLVRSAAVVVGAMARALRDGDVAAAAKLVVPARRYLKSKAGGFSEVPGTAVLWERRDVVLRLRDLVAKQLNSVRPNFHAKAPATIKQLAAVARVIVLTTFDDPEFVRPLLQKSPKAPSSRQGTTLSAKPPLTAPQHATEQRVATILKRELANGLASEEVAERAIIAALSEQGMNAKDIFKE